MQLQGGALSEGCFGAGPYDHPDLLVVYCETPLDFLEERLPDYFPSRLDRMLIPEIIMQQTLESDFRAGLTHLALEELFRSTFPVSGLEQ